MSGIWYGDGYLDMAENAGGRVERGPRPAPRFRPRNGPASLQAGAPLDRRRQLDDAFRAARARLPIEFYAPCGYGKSTLLREIAAQAPARLGVPGVYLDAKQDGPADLLQRVVHALYATDGPVRPTPAQCAQLLAQATPMVVLDDVVWGPDELAYLLPALSGCGVVLGCDQPRIGRRGMSQLLPGLSDDAALALVGRDLGRPLTGAELPELRRLAAAVEGQPLRLRQAAALVRTGEHSLAALAGSAEQGPTVLNRLSVNPLARTERRVLAVLALLGGALLPVDLVSVLSNASQVVQALAELRDRGLIEHRDDRFGLPVCRVPGYRELISDNLDLAGAIRDIVGWLGQRNPGGEDSLSLVNGVVSLIGYAAERRDWDGVARLVRVAEPILTLAGRWETCRHILDIGIQAANTTGDAAAEALFHHQQGTLAQCLGQADTAQQQLSRALQLRHQLSDHAGAAVTQHNLRQLAGPPTPPTPPPAPPASPKPNHRPRLAVAVTAVLAILALAVGIGVGVRGAGSTYPQDHAAVTTGPSTETTSPGIVSTGPGTGTTRPPGSGPPVLTPGRQDFPRTNVTPSHKVRSRKSFAVTNPNNEPITIGGPHTTGDAAFSVTPGTCPARLASHEKCAVTVVFDPNEIGTHKGKLLVPATGYPELSADLIGIGFATLTVSIMGSSIVGANVLDAPERIKCPKTCQVAVLEPQHATFILKAEPPTACTGCFFDRWTGCTSESKSTPPECTVTVVTDATVTAKFGYNEP
jgi:hypothetical protein